jgi:very-short-patch-repair endonuclease
VLKAIDRSLPAPRDGCLWMTSARLADLRQPAAMRIPEWFDPHLPLLDDRCPLPLDAPFTVAMAERWGVSRHYLRRLVAGGYVRRVLQGVYVVVQAVDDIDLRAAALGLVIPKSAVVTDRTAAWLHGVAILPRSAPYVPPPISVFQTSGTRVRRPQVNGGMRTLRPEDVMVVNGIRVTTPLRTAMDLGRLLWRFDAAAALDGFLRLGVPREEMIAELDRFKGYRGICQLRFLLPIADGRSESVGESALRLHWHDAMLPPPELQVWVQDDVGVDVYRLDLALPELRYAAEYDGEEHHGDEQEGHDRERRKWLSEERGWLIDAFRKDEVYGQNPTAPDRLRAGVAKARKALGGWNPPWAPRRK